MNDRANRLQSLRDAATDRYRRGDFEAAERFVIEALKLDPQSPDLWSNRGTLQAASRRPEDALVSFNRAVQLRPDFLTGIGNRAHILFELQRYAEAIPDYEKLLAADPNHPYSRGTLMYCRLQCCDWNRVDEERDFIQRALRAGHRVLPPVLLAMMPSPADQLLASQILSRDKVPLAPPLWRGERYRHQRIRVAYVSADFHAHATAVLTAGMFESHDRTRFETIAVSFGRDDGSPLRARLKRAFDRFIDVRVKKEDEIARLMRELEIDIAVDLKGYTSEARPAVFAHRPAPIQVNFLGFPGTMGANFIDYLVADRIMIGTQDEQHYSEKIVRLPDTYQPNDRTREVPDRVPTRAEAGLPEKGFVFCCFNNSYKILPPFFDVWMRLLKGAEGSVLWLLADNPTAVANLRREAQSRGVDQNRLIFAPRTRLPEHLARQRLADLFLDTLPYNAHTTCSDALWVGLPVLACMGESFASRVAASLLNAVGLPELVAQTLADYEEFALKLARDAAALSALKTKLASNLETAPLFDIARFTRHLEAAYTEMHDRQQRVLPPASFAVAPSA